MRYANIGVVTGLGLCAGAVAGAALGNVPAGIALGAAFGAALGAAGAAFMPRKNDGGQSTEDGD
jgi:hypothetical protein